MARGLRYAESSRGKYLELGTGPTGDLTGRTEMDHLAASGPRGVPACDGDGSCVPSEGLRAGHRPADRGRAQALGPVVAVDQLLGRALLRLRRVGVPRGRVRRADRSSARGPDRGRGDV